MGLLAVRNEYKSKSLTAPIMLRQIQKIKEMEQELGHKIHCWGTTASIGSYKAVSAFYENHQPSENGAFTTEARELALKIVSNYKLQHDPNNPFILKGVAGGTKYSESESQRIEEITAKKNFELFKNLGIKESNGDRMLILAATPSDEKFKRWVEKVGLINCP
jgi:hypothetical protein